MLIRRAKRRRTGGVLQFIITITITRRQLPLLPAFALTDYKSQGKTLSRAILDIESCRSIQSLYVLLSRVKNLDGVLILRPFLKSRLYPKTKNASDFNVEMKRLRYLSLQTYLTASVVPNQHIYISELIRLELEMRSWRLEKQLQEVNDA